MARSEPVLASSSSTTLGALTLLTLPLLTLSLTLTLGLTLTLTLGLTLTLTLTLGLTLTLTLGLTLTLTLSALTVAALTIAALTVAATATDSEPHAVILSATLSNGHKHRLMVAGRSHRANTVFSSGKTGSEVGRQEPVAIACVVDTLEEGKVLGIQRVGWVLLTVHVLHGNVGVTDDGAALEILRCGVVGVVRVGERSGLEVGDLDLEVDGLVFTNLIIVLRVDHDS
jgi:hypothetical protein